MPGPHRQRRSTVCTLGGRAGQGSQQLLVGLGPGLDAAEGDEHRGLGPAAAASAPSTSREHVGKVLFWGRVRWVVRPGCGVTTLRVVPNGGCLCILQRVAARSGNMHACTP